MLLAVTVTNERGESLRMELRNPDDSGLYFTNIDGIGGATATINSSDVASMDGAIFNSARLQTRNIVFTIKPTSDPSVEANRHKIYRYFPVKTQIQMEFETDLRITTATGYVESVNATIFSERETVQVSVLCTDPCFYMYKPLASSYGHGTPNFEFVFSDESVEQLGSSSTRENQILNSNFLDPVGYPANARDNMIREPYLKNLSNYNWPGFWDPVANEWLYYCAKNPNPGYDYEFVKDGMVLRRKDTADYDDPAQLFYFHYFKANESATGDYCVSFVSKEFGGVSRPFSLEEGNDAYYDIWLENWGNCRMAVQFQANISCLEVIFQVFPGAKVTLIEAKLEKGTTSTLFGGDPKRSYTKEGQTIRYWNLVQFDVLYHQLEIRDTGAYIHITPGSPFGFRWQQDVILTPDVNYTLSVMTSQNIYSATFKPERYPLSDVYYTACDISDNLEVLVHQHASLQTGEVMVREKTANSHSGATTIRAIKLELGTTQTLVNPQLEILTPYEVRQNEGTIEFGIMTKNTMVTINYEGDVPVGFTATIIPSAGPGQITFSNDKGEALVADTSKLNTSLQYLGGSFREGDEWTICTKIGQRRFELRRGTTIYNCLGLVDVNSQWPQIYPGLNSFQIVSHYYYPTFDMEIDYEEAYGGV